MRPRAGGECSLGDAPHNRQVTQFLEDLLALWRDELAAIVARDREARSGRHSTTSGQSRGQQPL